jgi:phosphoribosylformylglycinamidine (FGAM) synthase PurS component
LKPSGKRFELDLADSDADADADADAKKLTKKFHLNS